MDTAANPIYPENDPRHHAAKVKRALDDLIAGLREDTETFEEPNARALFETSAEILEGIRTAFDQYETRSRGSWRRP